MFNSPLKGTPNSSILPRTEPLACPLSKPSTQQSHVKPSMIPRCGPSACPLPHLKPEVDSNTIAYIIDEECSRLCSKSVSTFRGTSSSFIDDFQWDVLEKRAEAHSSCALDRFECCWYIPWDDICKEARQCKWQPSMCHGSRHSA